MKRIKKKKDIISNIPIGIEIEICIGIEIGICIGIQPSKFIICTPRNLIFNLIYSFLRPKVAPKREENEGKSRERKETRQK